MKLQYKIAVIGTIALFAWFVVPFPWSFDQTTETFSCASVDVKKLSEYDVSKIRDIPIVVTNQQLQESEIIHELVMRADNTSPPKNDRGYTELTLEEIISVHNLFREEITKQKGNPEKFVETPPSVHRDILSQPNMTGYLYALTLSPKISYNGNMYTLNGVSSFPPEPTEQINVQLENYQDNSPNRIIIEMNHEQLSQYPKILDAINQIGTRDDSVYVGKGVDDDTWDVARDWLDKHQTNQNVTRGSLISYNDSIYSIGFAIC